MECEHVQGDTLNKMGGLGLLWKSHHAADITKRNVKNSMGRLPVTYTLFSFPHFPHIPCAWGTF